MIELKLVEFGFLSKRAFYRDGKRVDIYWEGSYQELIFKHNENAKEELFLFLKQDIEDLTTYNLDQSEIDFLRCLIGCAVKFDGRYRLDNSAF